MMLGLRPRPNQGAASQRDRKPCLGGAHAPDEAAGSEPAASKHDQVFTASFRSASTTVAVKSYSNSVVLKKTMGGCIQHLSAAARMWPNKPHQVRLVPRVNPHLRNTVTRTRAAGTRAFLLKRDARSRKTSVGRTVQFSGSRRPQYRRTESAFSHYDGTDQ